MISRHSGIFNPEACKGKITIVGAGSTGSNVAMLLAKLGMRDITIYDDDTVEIHNLSHQDYAMSDIGQLKVEALAERIQAVTGYSPRVCAFKTDGKDIDTEILILAVDNMQARKDIVENARYQFCIDGRMGGEAIEVYSFSFLENEKYWTTWKEDKDIEDLPCGGKSINYVSYIISALIEITVTKILKGLDYPFEQTFDARNLKYNRTKNEV